MSNKSKSWVGRNTGGIGVCQTPRPYVEIVKILSFELISMSDTFTFGRFSEIDTQLFNVLSL